MAVVNVRRMVGMSMSRSGRLIDCWGRRVGKRMARGEERRGALVVVTSFILWGPCLFNGWNLCRDASA